VGRLDDELCTCGSGRLAPLCHGLRGSARRHRARELHALEELHDLALIFPFVRPKGAAIKAFADRLAADIGDEPRDSTPTEVAEGVRLLSPGERRRLVRSWAGRYPDRWRKVCSEVGDRGLAESTLLASAVRAAVADRVVSPPASVAELERGALEGSPGAALALAIAPQAVWSYEEALATRVPRATGQHIARVRAQVRRLRSRLPFDGLPRASATLERGCALVADDALATDVAELLLEVYRATLECRACYISQRN
jgi:hypothetical protein